MRPGAGWRSWVSLRFLTGRRGGRGRLVFIFSVVLIGAGVATLITILSVMNGLQQGYIRSILEIGSYHLRWTPDSDSEGDQLPHILEVISSDPQVSSVTLFREGQTMLSGFRPRPAGALVRGAPESIYADDKGLAENMDIVEGSFNLSGRGIVLGDELALNLGVSPGDSITALDLGGTGFSPAEVVLDVTGVFQSGYREYESTLAFTSLETVDMLFGSAVPEIGIKLKRLERDRAVQSRLIPQLSMWGGNLTSWRENNRSFFGALRTEKMMMLLLLALIFVVVAVNIDHSLRRMATERVEDLSILKAVGATPGDIRMLFLRQGLAIGVSGGFFGSVFGVLLGSNTDEILRIVRRVRYGLSGLIGSGSFGSNPVEAFFKNSEVMAGDVITIFLLAVIMSSLAGVRAASMAAKQKPAEVLRSE